MRSAVLALLFSACLAGQTASITGTAVHSVTGQPLSGVHVSVHSGNSMTTQGTAYGAISDRSGHFSISSIPPGTYLYDAALSGYVFLLSGEATFNSTALILKAGENVTDLNVKLAPQSVIAGRVLDAFGDPVVGMSLEVSNAAKDGHMSAVPRTGYSATDDRGQFLWIVGPGRYHLRVGGQPRMGMRPEIRDGVPELEYPPTYYPGVTDPEKAGVVEVGPGDAARGLEIRMSRQRGGTTVSGTVTGIPDGPGNRTAYLMLRCGKDEQMLNEFRNGTVGADGKYEFTGLAPGICFVNAYLFQQETLLTTPLVTRKVEGTTTIDLALAPAVELPGKLEIPQEIPHAERTIRLDPATNGINFTLPAAAGKDGSFVLKRITPGKVRVAVFPLPDNAYVKTLQLDGAVVQSNELDISAAAPGSLLKITLAANGAQLEGHMLDQAGERIAGSVGAVFLLRTKEEPVNPGNISQLSADGVYHFKNVRPGKYWMAAIDYVRSGQIKNSAEMAKAIEGSAVAVEVKENDRLTLDVKVAKKEVANAKP